MPVQKITTQEFIKAWNDSDSMDGVIEKTGYTYSTVKSIASRIRNYGVAPLKHFPTGRPKKVIER